jgi:hypothetical protein
MGMAETAHDALGDMRTEYADQEEAGEYGKDPQLDDSRPQALCNCQQPPRATFAVGAGILEGTIHKLTRLSRKRIHSPEILVQT